MGVCGMSGRAQTAARGGHLELLKWARMAAIGISQRVKTQQKAVISTSSDGRERTAASGIG